MTAKQKPATNIRRWSNEKLDMELSFANACADQDCPETVEWRDMLANEVAARQLGEAE
jgi:hypothetical protein